jgi:hypothetical protein
MHAQALLLALGSNPLSPANSLIDASPDINPDNPTEII